METVGRQGSGKLLDILWLEYTELDLSQNILRNAKQHEIIIAILPMSGKTGQ